MAEIEYIFYVTRVQVTNVTNSAGAPSKFHLSRLSATLFSCKSLISNKMISRVIWCKLALVNISKTKICTRPTGSCNFIVFEKFAHAY